MAGGCCGGCKTPRARDEVWRRVLWIALAINAGMFAVEIATGVATHSAALKADALDFLGDSANYAISLGVAGLILRWRARAALLKGVALLLLGLRVVGNTVWMALTDTVPEAETMVPSACWRCLPTLSAPSCCGGAAWATPTDDRYG